VPGGTSLITVVRIETPPHFVFPDPSETASVVASIAERRDIKALQIDYDARASELPFYKAFLTELRKRTDRPIGITALASWCENDAWFSGQPIAEATPMLFRMGPRESKDIRLVAPECMTSIGLSTDEGWPFQRPSTLHPGARIYVFNPHSWTRTDYDSVLKEVDNWR
jgi:hypothetical protein